MILIIGCTSQSIYDRVYCAEGLMWIDGYLHVLYSESEIGDKIEFNGEQHSYYVIEYSHTKTGIEVISYQKGKVEAHSKWFRIINGCKTKK